MSTVQNESVISETFSLIPHLTSSSFAIREAN
jgi:hypothetical protein